MRITYSDRLVPSSYFGFRKVFDLSLLWGKGVYLYFKNCTARGICISSSIINNISFLSKNEIKIVLWQDSDACENIDYVLTERIDKDAKIWSFDIYIYIYIYLCVFVFVFVCGYFDYQYCRMLPRDNRISSSLYLDFSENSLGSRI